ncbi:hypothetical protein AsAng_0043420 [Aureispira anguillae]|uniref:Uncharacterized protein n=1 Tax=Aureispira anguillae TaxID=2864201 RepID=A0A915YI39_9BACT|nr:hypothetical protein AsAng_0043420 [Aureispira anguillae]
MLPTILNKVFMFSTVGIFSVTNIYIDSWKEKDKKEQFSNNFTLF